MRIGKQRAEDILLLLVVLISAQGNIVVISDAFLLLTLGFAYYLFRGGNQKIQSNFFLFTVAFGVITFIYYLKFGWINPTSSLRAYLKILTAYLAVCVLKDSLFEKFETIIFRFALISLPLYAIQLISYQSLKSIIGLPESVFPFLDYRSDWYVNAVFFTLNDDGMFRNSGFCWEPKGFANLLCIALFFNLMIYKFKFNKRSAVMLIALLTSFSTVGYVVLITCIGTFYVYNQNARLIFLTIPLFIIAGYFLINQEFMLDKIKNEYNDRESYLEYITTEFDQETKSLGRFGSLLVDLQDFPKNPLFGVGMQDSERTQGQYTYLVRVNGLSETLSRFGLAGIFFVIATVAYSSARLFTLYNTKGAFFFFLAFMFISFGSALTLNLLFLMIQFFCFPKQKKALTQTHLHAYPHSYSGSQ